MGRGDSRHNLFYRSLTSVFDLQNFNNVGEYQRKKDVVPMLTVTLDTCKYYLFFWIRFGGFRKDLNELGKDSLILIHFLT